MKLFTRYHCLRVSDNDIIYLLRFDGKLQYKKNNDTYGSLAAKTAKDDVASENYVKRETVEMLKNKRCSVRGERQWLDDHGDGE
jgi:hypothetical protein